jgi:hypothetical protein
VLAPSPRVGVGVIVGVSPCARAVVALQGRGDNLLNANAPVLCQVRTTGSPGIVGLSEAPTVLPFLRSVGPIAAFRSLEKLSDSAAAYCMSTL